MAEETNAPVPEEKKQEAARPEGELLAELEQIRFRNKVLKVTASVLVVLFIVLAAAAYMAYRKISETKAAIESAFQNYQPAGSQPEGMPLPGSFPSVSQSTGMPLSTLGLFSGSIPGQQAEAFNPVEGAKVNNIMAKYADRPVVKEFLEDLKRDPDIARAIAQSKGSDPMAVLNSVKNAKGINTIMAKYVTRPDFLKLMMEAMKDPDLKPFMKGMPGAPAQPQTVPVSVEPAAQPSQQEEDQGPMTLDPSAISGPAAAAPARRQKAPPPVDTH